MPSVMVLNTSAAPVTVAGQTFPARLYRTIDVATWNAIPDASKGEGRLVAMQVIEDPAPLKIAADPSAMQVSADFSPAHYYATPQGGTRLFGLSADAVTLPAGTVTPVLIIINPADSGAVAWVWRTTIGANVNCRVRRLRLTAADVRPNAGAQPLTPTNRGGGANTSKLRAYNGSQVTLPASALDAAQLTRADPLSGWTPAETYVHGSFALRPGAVSAYAFEPDQGAGGTRAWGTVEYVYWELPLA